jgi:hypothetical protein
MWSILGGWVRYTSPNDLQKLAAHRKKKVKAKQVLLDSMKDHLIPHI